MLGVRETPWNFSSLLPRLSWHLSKRLNQFVKGSSGPLTLEEDYQRGTLTEKKDYHSHFNIEILTFIVHNSYTDASEPKGFEFQTYRQQLQEAAPDLFSGRYRVRSAHFFHFLDLQKLG